MLFSITYMEWPHVFPYIYTHFHVSHFCIYIIISVFVNYAVKKRLQIDQYCLLCSCLINLRTIMAVTFDLVA